MKLLGRILCCWAFDRHHWVTEHYTSGPYLERVYRRCTRCNAHGASVIRPYRDDHDAG